MFQSPFSFEGRIRRMEYGVSILVYIIVAIVLGLAAVSLEESVSGTLISFLFFFVGVGMIWFMLAQGSKRCHDMGYSGFFQLIPMFGILMVFMDGQRGYNEYGPNPKGIGNETGFGQDIPGRPLDQI